MTIGTRRNVERTGQRYVSRLSAIARQVEDIRVLDLDLWTYCPYCKRPELFAEVKKYMVTDAEWAQTRMLAEDYGCMALLVIETPGDIGVRIYWDGDITPVTWGGEEDVARVLRDARDRHVCVRR